MTEIAGLYDEVQQDKLYLKVADRIQNLILMQQILAGDRLPPERELAEGMGVSRTVVREAFKALQERGLIEIISGRGAFVARKELAAERIHDSINIAFRLQTQSYDHLSEIRETLETDIAELAASRASQQHIEQLTRAIEAMDRAIDSPEAYVQADLEFHSVLAAATGNPLFGALVSPVIDLLHDARLLIFEAPGAPQHGQEGHREILRCIKERDVRGAREAMHRHLLRSNADLKKGMSLADARARLPGT